jgi:pilus assembly protein CpaE
MSGITIVSGNPAVEQTFLSLFGKSMAVRRAWSDQWRDPVEVAMDSCAANPELVVLGSDVGADQSRAIIPEIDRRFPSTTILCLTLNQDTDYALSLLRLGARDVLVESGPTEDFRNQVEPVIQVAKTRHQATVEPRKELRRRVITVLSPKGGTGKTTVATNLAVGLAQRLAKQVALLDLDVQFGDCAPALGIDSEYSLADALKGVTHERSNLKVFLTHHKSGLAVLSPPDDLVAAEEIDPDELKRLLSAYIEEFPFVVVDTAGGIDSFALAAMEQATDLLFISTTDVPAIRAVRRQLDALDQIGYVSQRRLLVLNRSNAKVGLSSQEIEAAIGLQATFEIPSTRLIPVSTNEGVAVIERDGGGNVARKFEEIARYFAPEQDDGSGWQFWNRRKDR